MHRTIFELAFVLATLLVFMNDAPAASDTPYPSRPIRFILPVPAGGSIDPIVRPIVQRLSERWGQQVVTDNRPGAGGIIGMELAANSPPDGYTWVLGAAGNLAINPSLYRKLPYDSVRDFTPVTLLALQPLIVVVPPQLAVKSLKDFIALARAKPGTLNFGSGGVGTTPHLAFELFKASTAVDIVHVPYKGSSPAMSDLLSGQIQVMFTGIPAGLPQVRLGRLRGLALTGARRSDAAPEVPTIAEAGVPGYKVEQWYGILLPRGAAPTLVNRINQEVRATLSTPEMRQRLIAQGVEPAANSPIEFAQFIKAEIAQWAKAVALSGAKAE